MDYSFNATEEQACQNAQRTVMPPIFRRYCIGDVSDSETEILCNEMRNHLFAQMFGDCESFWRNRGVAGTMIDLSRAVKYEQPIDPEIRATRARLATVGQSGKCSNR